MKIYGIYKTPGGYTAEPAESAHDAIQSQDPDKVLVDIVGMTALGKRMAQLENNENNEKESDHND